VNNAALANIHLNNDERTTIAQVIVPASIHREAIESPEPMNSRAHLENVVRSALLLSFESMGFQYSIKES